MNSYNNERLGKYLEDNPLEGMIDDSDETIQIEAYVVEKSFKQAPLAFTLYVEFDSRLKRYLGMFSHEFLQDKLFNSTFIGTLKYFCRAHLTK